MFENMSALFVLQGVSVLVSVITVPYLVRVLGFEKYGLIAFTQAFAQYFVVFSDYGFNFSATGQIAVLRDDAAAVARTFSAVMVVKASLALTGLLVLTGVVASVSRFRSDAVLYYISYLAVIGTVCYPQWYFQGIERMRYITALTGVARLLTAGALFVFVRGPANYLVAAGIQASGPVIAGVIGLWVAIVRFDVRFRVPRREDCVNALRDGWHLFLTTAAATLYSNTNVFVVGLLAGDLQAGYFAAADKIIRGVLNLFSPIMQAIYPYMSALAAHSHHEALRFVRRSAVWLGGLSLGPSLVILVFAPLIVVVFFGRGSSHDTVTVLRWIAMLPFIMVMGYLLGVQTMIPFGLSREFSWIVLAAGLVNVMLSLALTQHLGAVGAAISLLTVEGGATATMAVVLRLRGLGVLERSGAWR